MCHLSICLNLYRQEFKWQCGDGIIKSESKQCPASIPIPFPTDDTEGVVESQLAVVECDTATNPTGQPEDGVCQYDDCQNDHSAICACVDMEARGMGQGTQWVCLQSTCNCEEIDKGDSAASMATASFLAAVPLLAAMI